MRKNKSVFVNKLVFSYSIVIIVMVCIFFISFCYYIYQTSQEISYLNNQELADKTMKQVESFLDDMDYVAYLVMTNSTLLNTYSQLQQNKDYENYFDKDIVLNIDVGSILTSINGHKNSIWRISVYNQYGDFISSGALPDKNKVKDILRNSNVSYDMIELMNSTDKYIVLPPQADKWSNMYSSQYITIKCPLMNIYSEEVYGIVEVQEDIKKLIEKIEFSDIQKINLEITDQNGNQVFNNIIDNMSRKEMNSVTKESAKYGWSVTLFQKRTDIISLYKNLIVMIFLGCVCFTLLAIRVVFIIARKLSKPLITLKDTVSRINIQNIYPTDTPHYNIDEVKELNIAFSAMLNRLVESIALEKKANLMALQSQMNPHFLYNTLAVISAVGSEAGNDKVVKLCDSLTSILRYTSYYEETSVTLRKEIENAVCYLDLMKGRYESNLTYYIEADENVMDIKVPKLIVQPLVENCFKHGFANIESPYIIKISAGIEDEKWYIKIADNGSGFTSADKEKVDKKINEYWDKINKNMLDLETEGIGLISTIIRLKLNTGKDIDYSIENNIPTGSIITIRGKLYD